MEENGIRSIAPVANLLHSLPSSVFELRPGLFTHCKFEHQSRIRVREALFSAVSIF